MPSTWTCAIPGWDPSSPCHRLGKIGNSLDSDMKMIEDSDHAYFQAVEEIFVELRGAPLLLSPADWQVARRWHQDGVPLDLIKRTLEEVFAKRKERGAKGKISSLRYCAPAVEAAWEELRELTAVGERAEAPAFEIRPRLAALAAALSRSFPEIQERIMVLD